MKIALVAATLFEIEPTIRFLEHQGFKSHEHEFSVLVTGIGSIAATYQLTNFIHTRQPGYLLQAGIAGTFKDEFPPGDMVIVKEEIMGDLGAQEGKDFSDIFDLNLLAPSAFPFDGKRLKNPHADNWNKYKMPAVNGITVNEITTSPERILLLRNKYNCDVESMEGAAFHYVCLQQDIGFIQLRAISNFIGERDKKNWKMKQAIENLNNQLITIIQQSSFL